MSNDMSSDEGAGARLTELESKLMHADDQIEALNRTVYRQQQALDRLERELRALRDQLDGLQAAGAPGAPRDEIPPHY